MQSKKIYLTLDTETIGLRPQNFVYDLGYIIHDKKGNILKSRNFLVREIITDGSLMMGAYYAKKVFSFYIPALESNAIELYYWRDIVETMRRDILEQGVNVLTAYNAPFDIGAMRSTGQKLNAGRVFDNKIDALCIWNYACRVLLNRPTYYNMARQYGWISEAKNYRTTAEHTYKYITGNPDFIESHTALSDAIIETDILVKCIAQKKRTPYNDLRSLPWQIAQTLGQH